MRRNKFSEAKPLVLNLEQPRAMEAVGEEPTPTVEDLDTPVPVEPPKTRKEDEDTSPEKKISKVKPSGKWRVIKETLANVNGSFTRLVEGQVLDPLGYSDQVIESLRTQGVQLEQA